MTKTLFTSTPFYTLNVSGKIAGQKISFSDSFTWWIIPYLGVVKEESADTPFTLFSFAVWGGEITETTDTDADGLIDFLELSEYDTSRLTADSDGDGMPDGWEAYNNLIPLEDDSQGDPDNDLLYNFEEFQRGSDPHDVLSPCSATDFLVLRPSFTATSSLDTDRVVFFNSSQAVYLEVVSCVPEEKDCRDEWDFGGVGDIVGGNGDDIIVYRYDASGDYIISLTMTEGNSGTSVSANAEVTAKIVETPLPAIDFATTVYNATVSLTITDLDLTDSDVASVIVFWGDRYRTQDTVSLPATINHTYTRTGSEYHIRVKAILTDGESFNYTFIADEGLTVSIP